MKSYDCTICFQFFRYIIHDNGVLEYLELSGTGETKKSESCPLSAYNPIPEKKKKDSPYAGFLLFLFFSPDSFFVHRQLSASCIP